MGKKVVIIGAGYAGILSAKKLAKQAKKAKLELQITLIDRNPFHTMLTELHEVAAGRVDEDSITISLEKVFAGRGVEVVLDNVVSVDYAARSVQGESRAYAYDYLVMAAGSKPTFFGVPGAAEYAHKLWSYQDAVALREHIQERFRQARVCLDPQERQRLLTFHVIGAGFTGVEMVGELAEWVPVLCEKHEIPRDEVKLINMDILDRVVPTLSPACSAKVQRRMEKMGIEVRLGAGVCAIKADHVEVKKAGSDVCEREDTGTVIWAAGIEAADITAQAGPTLANAGRGRIKTDQFLRSVSDPRVYVAGDNIFYIPEGEERPIPQMVEVAEHASAAVSHNLMVDLTEGSSAKFSAYQPVSTANHGVMVCVGGRWGAAEVGTDKKKFRLCSFFAMFSKHFINLVYFVQVLGWNKIMSYLRHEFFTIRNRRSFVGGHFSNRTPSFLLVLLRLWLGAVWVFEGVMKIVEGWFSQNMLKGFFEGANAWYASLMATTGGGGGGTDAIASATQSVATTAGAAADAVSAATGAVEGAVQGVAKAAGDMLLNWNFGLFRILFAVGKDPAHAKLSDYALKIDVPLMNWFLEKAVLPSNGFSMFMQIFIVVAEILVGLALMGGFLTTPVAVASLVLQAMFLMTTGLYLNNIWMIFASIAMLFGAGKVFGLDYYAQPLMKRGWKKIGFIKKWYLYHD